MLRPPSRIGLCAVALVLAGCDVAPAGRILSLEATGSVESRVFVDHDGNGRLDASLDAPARSVRLALVRSGADTVATATTNDEGVGVIAAVPVGTYRLVVDPAWLGDSIRVVKPDTARLIIGSGDTARVVVALGYPLVRVAEARAGRGRLLSLQGIALSGTTAFGDSTLHVADSTAAIRAVQVSSLSVQPGDSVRITGRVGESGGQPVLVAPTVLVHGRGPPPPAVRLTTGAAASAEGGTRDAGLVSIADATVFDVSRTSTGDTRLRVNDGSGTLEVVFDRSAGITSEDPIVAGAIVDATGLLVPGNDGTWALKPRGSADVRSWYPSVTVAEARRMVGKVISLTALALNGWITFGDATLHIADSTGALRAVQVSQSSVEPGDSVRLLGFVVVRDGQPTFTGASVSIRAKNRSLPAAKPLTTAAAGTAGGGALDAALVRIEGAVIQDTTTTGGDLRLTVDDGSGPLTVLLDRDTGIGLGAFVPNKVVRATGLLVPQSAGRGWLMKPRGPDDIEVR